MVCQLSVGTRGALMKQELYACIHIADLPAQALVRLRRDLKSKAIAVLDGRPPQETVCSLNQHARLRGASLGMTRLEAEGINDLLLLPRSRESEIAATAVILECAATFSPRIEEVRSHTSCTFVLDISGTERLFGPLEKLTERLRFSLVSAGFRSSLAVSASFDTARIKATAGRGISIIPSGEEAKALANLPIDSLELDEDTLETFAIWGINTLGELANLPETELVMRLGSIACVWRNLARGKAEHVFLPIEPTLALEEFCEFETPVEEMDSLLFVGSSMIDCLAARASSHALSIASMALQMKLDGGFSHNATIRPAIPTIDRKFLLKLLQLEIATNPPQSAVGSLTLRAEAAQSSKLQLGLFTPQLPEPSRLDVTLARLKAIVGNDRVGSPVLDDTHRPGSFHMEDFNASNKEPKQQNQQVRMAIRRMRPPVPIRVVFRAMKPAVFRDTTDRFEIAAAYGPWRTSGCWWSTDAWDTEEWDVLAFSSNGTSFACLLIHDLKRHEWLLEALYD
jgi:protein ImuB